MIDYRKSEKKFKEYLKEYDLKQEGISLKIKHTFNVVNNILKIAESENFPNELKELAKIIALLHDIGRFEQIKQVGVFDDSKFDHAKFGVKFLFEQNNIINFVDERKYDEIIHQAIKYHSCAQLPSHLSKDELLFSKLIRDADKLDIFDVKIKDSFHLMYHTSQSEIEYQEISDEVYKTLLNHKTISRKNCTNDLDVWFMTIGFVYDFNFIFSFEETLKRGSLLPIFNFFNIKNRETKKRIEHLKEDVLKYMKDCVDDGRII